MLNNAFPFEQGSCRNNVTAGSQRMLLYQIRFPAVNAFPFQLEKNRKFMVGRCDLYRSGKTIGLTSARLPTYRCRLGSKSPG